MSIARINFSNNDWDLTIEDLGRACRLCWGVRACVQARGAVLVPSQRETLRLIIAPA
jgi:hypothetical protein